MRSSFLATLPSFRSSLSLFAALSGLALASACGDDAGEGGGGASSGSSGATTGAGSTATTGASTVATASSVTSSSTGSALCPATATTVDLDEVFARAEERMQMLYGGVLTDPEIFFQEGINGVGGVEQNDMGAIVVTFDGPDALKVLPGQRFVYRANVWGVEDFMIAVLGDNFQNAAWDVTYPPGDQELYYRAPTEAVGVLVDGLTPAEEATLVADFESAFPGSTFNALAGGVFFFQNVAPASLSASLDFLAMRPEVEVTEISLESYLIEFGFGPMIDLSMDLGTGPHDVYEEHAFLSRWLREGGVLTKNLPTLPAPFGPGPLLRSVDGRYAITFAEGADEAACIAGLEACGFTTQDAGGQWHLLDPSYIGATALRHTCVAALTPM